MQFDYRPFLAFERDVKMMNENQNEGLDNEGDNDNDLTKWNPEQQLNRVKVDKLLSGLIHVDSALKTLDFPFIYIEVRFDTRAELGEEDDGRRRRDLREHLDKHAWATLGRYEIQ